jgi:hypothetical protein
MHRDPKTPPRSSSRSSQSARTVQNYPQMGVIFAKENKIIENHRHIIMPRPMAKHDKIASSLI